MSVIEKIRQRKATTSANAAAEYQSLVQRVGRSENVAESEVESIVNGAGKSLDDLESEVGKYRQRLALKAKANTLLGRQAILDKQGTEFRAFVARYEKVREEFVAEEIRRQDRMIQAEQQVAEAMKAQNALQAAPPAWLDAELQKIRTQSSEQRQQIERLRARQGVVQQSLAQAYPRGYNPADGRHQDTRHEELQRLIPTLADEEGRLQKLEDRQRHCESLLLEVWPLPSDLDG